MKALFLAFVQNYSNHAGRTHPPFFSWMSKYRTSKNGGDIAVKTGGWTQGSSEDGPSQNPGGGKIHDESS